VTGSTSGARATRRRSGRSRSTCSFSYVDSSHEEAIGAYLAERIPDLPVSLSSDVCPIWREYQRSATVITDAFIKRIIDRFVGKVSADLETAGSRRRSR